MARRVVFNMAAAKRQAGAQAQVIEVEHVTNKLPVCSWCRKKKLAVILEYIQEGIWWSDFLIIAKCKACSRCTIFTHQSEDESNVQP